MTMIKEKSKELKFILIVAGIFAFIMIALFIVSKILLEISDDYGYGGDFVINTKGEIVSDYFLMTLTYFNSKGVALASDLDKGLFFTDVYGNEVYEEASKIVNDIEDRVGGLEYVHFDDEIIIINESTFGNSVHFIKLETGEDCAVTNAKTRYSKDTYSEGLLGLYDKGSGLGGYVDQNGIWIISPQYEEVNAFKDGLALVKKDDLYGFIDKQGNYVIEPEFIYANNFSEGFAAVAYKENEYGFIDTKGNIVIEPQFENVGDFCEGLAWAKDKQSDRYGFIDKNGDVAIDFQFGLADNFCYGLASVRDAENGKNGYIDTSGKLVIPFKYMQAYNFTADGLAMVSCDDYNESYIDRNGNFLFKPQSINISLFVNGYATAKLDHKQRLDYSETPTTQAIEQYSRSTLALNILELINKIEHLCCMAFGSILIIYSIVICFRNVKRKKLS